MKQILIIILSTLTLFNLHAQNNDERIKVLVSARVDTASNEIKNIINLYENYLNSSPDSIYNNPYWNKKEKELYKDFDFSRTSMFQGGLTADQLSTIFNPFIMSVEPLGEKYQIRVLYSSPTTDPQYAGSKVWCIQKLNAIKENQNWVLENLIVELSKKWVTKTFGHIEYVYPPSHVFDIKLAKLSEQFCNDIVGRFNPSYNETFKYYVTSCVDDMGLLENFDYYFVGITSGKARENMILTAKGNEYYPHEFVHKSLPKNQNRGLVIEEGLAVFLGTKINEEEEYKDLLSKLGNDLKTSGEKINFKSVVSQEIRFNGYQTAYPTGAAICELIFNKTGDEGLLLLIQANTSNYDNIVSAAMSITALTFDELVKEWNEVIMKYNH
ncbi:MAG: hypothetical protein JKY54_05810 [Flavobacteriales bacterium]|nr:hypothetical protein [Flavobacteriales bacterium]